MKNCVDGRDRSEKNTYQNRTFVNHFTEFADIILNRKRYRIGKVKENVRDPGPHHLKMIHIINGKVCIICKK